MDIAQVLGHRDQAPGDQHDATKALVAQLHHRASHHAGRLLDREADCDIEFVEAPQYVRVGIAHDRDGAALFLGDDERTQNPRVALALPGAVSVFRAQQTHQRGEERARQRGGVDLRDFGDDRQGSILFCKCGFAGDAGFGQDLAQPGRRGAREHDASALEDLIDRRGLRDFDGMNFRGHDFGR